MIKINPNEYHAFYQPYIDQVSKNKKNIVENLIHSMQMANQLFVRIDKNKYEYSYAPGKWTIKELIQHVIDSERVFTYRALRIARLDKTALPGFDENDYVKVFNANQRSFNELLEELRIVRKSTILLFKSLDKKSMENMGIASGSNISVSALGYIISGHLLHHMQVINARYL